MKPNNTHIINRVFLEVHTRSKQTGYELKDRLGLLLEQELFPILENYFDEFTKDKNLDTLQLESLQLNINLNKQDDYKQLIKSIKESFITNFEKKIDATDTKEVQILSAQESLLQSFFVFLEEGVLPWNSSLNQNKEFDMESIRIIIKQKGFKSLFIKKLENKIVLKRLINQFDNQIITLLLRQVYKENKQQQIVLSDEITPLLDKLSFINRGLVWTTIIHYLLYDKKQSLIQEFTQIIKKIKLSKSLSSTQKEPLIATLLTILNAIDTTKQTSIEKDFNDEKAIIDKTTNDREKNHKELGKQNTNINLKAENQKIKKSEKTKKETLINHPDNDTPDNRNSIPENKKNNLSQNKSVLKEKDQENKLSEEKNELFIKNKAFLDKELFQSQNKQEYYIQNAGLILLHPFLKQFFETCGLLDNQNQIKDKELAAHLLHYIATKKEKQAESTMVFEKFLCGIPIKQSIQRDISISNKLKKQVDDLLQSVLNNWEILKEASTDLLRNEFLQRPGKLSFKADNPKIVIERKTQDILIDKISWNLSISKLPWIDKIIFTDW